MEDPPESGDAPRRPHLDDAQLHAIEHLLNDLSRHGLEVERIAPGQWQWRWQGQTGVAAGLGSAVLDAVYWYFGLTG